MVLALCVVHNFIRLNGGAGDDIAKEAQTAMNNETNSYSDQGELPEHLQTSTEGNRIRDKIAMKMWSDYCKYIAAKKESRRQKRRANYAVK